MSTETMEIKVNRMHILDGDQSVKAFADITLNDAILVKGIMVVDGRNGLFVSMPREQAKDQKWYDTVRCLNKGRPWRRYQRLCLRSTRQRRFNKL